MGPDDFYTMFRLDGADVAAGYTELADERERGIPPHWNLYIAVENADAGCRTKQPTWARKCWRPRSMFSMWAEWR